MTIAIALRVYDGLVLASDSASTMTVHGADGSDQVVNIYNNANKIFNLHKDLPIGAFTWGLGNMGPASISTLSKDLRRRLMGLDPAHLDWALDPQSYTIDEVAGRAQEFFEGEHFSKLSDEAAIGEFGYLVGGYSAKADQPDAVQMNLSRTAGCTLVPVLDQAEGGATWYGQPEAIARLLLGTSTATEQALIMGGLQPDQAAMLNAQVRSQVAISLVSSAMPIQDAIELATFLVDLTIKFVRFSPGHATVGGPVEVASITKHEGFRWVARKHFFDTRLNPQAERS